MYDYRRAPVRMIDGMRIHDPRRRANRVISVVRNPVRVVVIIIYGSPGSPPVRPAVPSPMRHPYRVVRTIHVLHDRPRPYIDDNGGSVCTGIGTHFACGFDDGSDAVDVFIASDLKNGLAVGQFLQGDHSDVLFFSLRNHCLKYKDVHVLILAGKNPDVVDVSVSIQVKVVDLAVRCIQQTLEFLGCGRLPEQLKSTFQTKIVAWDFSLVLLSKGYQSRRCH
jgi:hypothetical protein